MSFVHGCKSSSYRKSRKQKRCEKKKKSLFFTFLGSWNIRVPTVRENLENLKKSGNFKISQRSGKSQGISQLLKNWRKYSKIKIFGNFQNYPEKQGNYVKWESISTVKYSIWIIFFSSCLKPFLNLPVFIVSHSFNTLRIIVYCDYSIYPFLVKVNKVYIFCKILFLFFFYFLNRTGGPFILEL